MPIYQLDGVMPEFESRESNFLADDAVLVGKVRIGRDASIWFGAVLRGDNEWIEIGTQSNVQEHAILHTDMGFPLVVGNGCTIGHRAILHGCTVGGNSLIGMGAIVLNGAKIGRNCLVGAGALVTEGKEFPDGSLIVGMPAKLVRPLGAEEVAKLSASAAHYAENGRRFRDGLAEL